LSFTSCFSKLAKMHAPLYNYRSSDSAHDLFSRLPKAAIQRLSLELKRRAPAFGLTYVDEKGKTAVITLTLRPRLLPLNRRRELWGIIRTLDGAFRKIAPLYFEKPSLSELFPFSNRERDWISLMREPSYRPGRIASRWDANTTFGDEDWKNGFSCFEVNGVGVGGMWYGPASSELALKTVVPELTKLDPRFRPFSNQEMRRLLLEMLLAQRKKMGRTRGVMALVMEKQSGSNYVEFECLAKFYTSLGYPSIVTEPTDFSLRKGELYARGKKIDVLYRDTTLSELCAFEEKGCDLGPLREAFRRGQIISSLEGEFDHKSAFEVFTHPEYAKFFTARECRIFKYCLLWTRLFQERKTTDPKGRQVDLVPYVHKNQTQLVLKPNRLYGGKGVVFGREVGRTVWNRKIQTALKEPGDWVVQKAGALRSRRFYRPEKKGVSLKDLYVVSGFFATDKGLGIVGRMSERTVVNVARRGGLTPILLIP